MGLRCIIERGAPLTEGARVRKTGQIRASDWWTARRFIRSRGVGRVRRCRIKNRPREAVKEIAFREREKIGIVRGFWQFNVIACLSDYVQANSAEINFHKGLAWENGRRLCMCFDNGKILTLVAMWWKSKSDRLFSWCWYKSLSVNEHRFTSSGNFKQKNKSVDQLELHCHL